MTINGYSIDEYWLLFYKWLMVVIILMAIDVYWLLFYKWLLMVILLMTIDDYFIDGY